MKRLCVFYKHADRWIGKPIEWMVCKECQRKIQRGDARLKAGIRALPEGLTRAGYSGMGDTSKQPDWRKIARQQFVGYLVVGDGPFAVVHHSDNLVCLYNFRMVAHGHVIELEPPAPPRWPRRVKRKMRDDDVNWPHLRPGVKKPSFSQLVEKAVRRLLGTRRR